MYTWKDVNMKRTILLLFTLLTIFMTAVKVNAVEINLSSNNDVKYLATCTSTDLSTCGALLGDPKCDGTVAYYLQLALNVIKYVGVVLCIFLTIVDFAKALFSDDKDMFKPLTKKAFARLIYAVLLFLLPSIVKVLLTLIDVYGTCGIA